MRTGPINSITIVNTKLKESLSLIVREYTPITAPSPAKGSTHNGTTSRIKGLITKLIFRNKAPKITVTSNDGNDNKKNDITVAIIKASRNIKLLVGN